MEARIQAHWASSRVSALNRQREAAWLKFTAVQITPNSVHPHVILTTSQVWKLLIKLVVLKLWCACRYSDSWVPGVLELEPRI